MKPSSAVMLANCKVNNDLIAHYQLFREYVEHEDDLINHRTTWHNTIQGLLFTALAFALKAEPNVTAAKIQATLAILLPVLGLLIATFAYRSIDAADRALNELSRRWHTILSTYPAESQYSVPGLTGGGDEKANKWGKWPAFMIPLLIGITWLVLLGVNLNVVFRLSAKFSSFLW